MSHVAAGMGRAEQRSVIAEMGHAEQRFVTAERTVRRTERVASNEAA